MQLQIVSTESQNAISGLIFQLLAKNQHQRKFLVVTRKLKTTNRENNPCLPYS